jgi:hypothetical protein
MITRAAGLGMGVGSFSRLLREVDVLTMQEAVLDTTQCVESVCKGSPSTGVR